MHIHGGQLNANAAMHGGRASEAALSARRAEETRKKLFARSSELDALSSADGAETLWMVGAWAGANSGANSGSGSDSASSARTSVPSSLEQSGEELDEIPCATAAGPVSFWA